MCQLGTIIWDLEFSISNTTTIAGNRLKTWENLSADLQTSTCIGPQVLNLNVPKVVQSAEQVRHQATRDLGSGYQVWFRV